MGARIEPTADMNPILLKPEADARSQVVVMGRPWRTLRAAKYYEHKRDLWSMVTAALDRLRAAYDLVIIEGAGSSAEINLKAGDIVNMAVADYAQAPVLLVGDIDRGGIFAQLLGTLWLLDPDELRLVRGLVVNKFRGDPDLFADGIRILEERGGVPVVGMIPFLHDLGIPEEDAVAIENQRHQAPNHGADSAMIDVAVIALPRIANFDDFDPLAAEPGVQVRYISSRQALGSPHAVILPGTKSTMADLSWLQAQGLAEAIQELAAAGSAVVGICGGYQMLGRTIRDPDHTESPVDVVSGLGLLPAETVFESEKATHRAQARLLGGSGWLADLTGQTVRGYEIHMGHTQGDGAWLEITERSGTPVSLLDGIVNSDGRIWGCYLHGLFENQVLRHAWLSSLGWHGEKDQDTSVAGYEEGFERLADEVEAALDMDYLEDLIAR